MSLMKPGWLQKSSRPCTKKPKVEQALQKQSQAEQALHKKQKAEQALQKKDKKPSRPCQKSKSPAGPAEKHKSRAGPAKKKCRAGPAKRTKLMQALHSIQVGVDVSDEAWLAAKVQQALQNPNGSCVWDRLHVSAVCNLCVADKLHFLGGMSGSALNLSRV